MNASPGSFSQTGSGTTATFTGLPAGVSYLFTVTNNQSCTSGFSTSATIGNALTIPPVSKLPVVVLPVTLRLANTPTSLA